MLPITCSPLVCMVWSRPLGTLDMPDSNNVCDLAMHGMEKCVISRARTQPHIDNAKSVWRHCSRLPPRLAATSSRGVSINAIHATTTRGGPRPSYIARGVGRCADAHGHTCRATLTSGQIYLCYVLTMISPPSRSGQTPRRLAAPRVVSRALAPKGTSQGLAQPSPLALVIPALPPAWLMAAILNLALTKFCCCPLRCRRRPCRCHPHRARLHPLAHLC